MPIIHIQNKRIIGETEVIFVIYKWLENCHKINKSTKRHYAYLEITTTYPVSNLEHVAHVSLGPWDVEGCVAKYHIVTPEITNFASKHCVKMQVRCSALGSRCRLSCAGVQFEVWGWQPPLSSKWEQGQVFELRPFLKAVHNPKILENLLRMVKTAQCSTSTFRILF